MIGLQQRSFCLLALSFLFSLCFSFLCADAIFWQTAQAMSLDELDNLSSRFEVQQSILLPYNLRNKKNIKEILYGNSQMGYYVSQNWSVSAGTLTLLFTPPTYHYPIFIKAVSRQGTTTQLMTYNAKSPVPAIFKRITFQLSKGPLSEPFYLINGALPRRILHDPSFSSLDPELFRKNHHRFTFIVVINRFGEIVWLHVPIIGDALFSSYLSAKKVGDGFYGMMFGKHSGYFEIVRHNGIVERRFSSKDAQTPFVMHHDFETIASKKLYAVGNEVKNMHTYTKSSKDKNTTFVTDTIIGIDLLNQSSRKLLGFDKYFHPGITPYTTGDAPDDKKFVLWGQPKADVDFLHINAVDYVPKKGVLVSFRNISKVGMIDNSFDKLLWTLGSEKEDTYYISSKAHQFHHQHTPIMLSDNSLLLFDNAITTKESRVVKYQLNRKKGRAHMTWEFKPTPQLFSKDRSSVYVLSNNNYGIYFVNPRKKNQKVSSIPNKDIYIEVNPRNNQEVGRMEITFPVASPGYRMLPLETMSNDHPYQGAPIKQSWHNTQQTPKAQ